MTSVSGSKPLWRRFLSSALRSLRTRSFRYRTLSQTSQSSDPRHLPTPPHPSPTSSPETSTESIYCVMNPLSAPLPCETWTEQDTYKTSWIQPQCQGRGRKFSKGTPVTYIMTDKGLEEARTYTL
ncbi:hypothetical protein [Wenzhou pacific spadenose shark paramyxovirus]|uniref:Uncharacterized protein n=1 Tax=Wenzhou pacific spadenose shark paramyxovirus TaxID=2116452 RepID=A0A2P1GMY1_9MONO|nr:hypothetical protein QKD25_gp02 [Wenzhou pacific spadenose shark paramyxovirus]AVM87357.1 hypothetical protein [Wenzhou pacific spadenose shark paramyxovirus]